MGEGHTKLFDIPIGQPRERRMAGVTWDCFEQNGMQLAAVGVGRGGE